MYHYITIRHPSIRPKSKHMETPNFWRGAVGWINGSTKDSDIFAFEGIRYRDLNDRDGVPAGCSWMLISVTFRYYPNPAPAATLHGFCWTCDCCSIFSRDLEQLANKNLSTFALCKPICYLFSESPSSWSFPESPGPSSIIGLILWLTSNGNPMEIWWNLSETWQNPSFYKSSKFRSFPSRSSAVTQVLPSSIDTSTRTIPGNAGIILMFVRLMCHISESSWIRHESSSSCGFGPLWASASITIKEYSKGT